VPALTVEAAVLTLPVALALALTGLGVRSAARAASRHRRLRRPRRAVVLGTGTTSRDTTRALLTRPETGVAPVGAVGDPRTVRGLPVVYLGPAEALPAALREAAADTVVVALDGPASDAERAAVRACLSGSMRIWAVGAHLDTLGAHAHTSSARAHPTVPGPGLVRLSTRPESRLRRAARAHCDRWAPTSRR
jgi:hypothetical protein